ncbi:MAG: RNA 2',3'-cyclic phosphodiesterase [Anaerolineae bacterium]|nr:RNA 2',3'-cyclic phosphodiesterase [Anaerolineae bacterium]
MPAQFLRLFIAIDLTSELRDAISVVQDDLRRLLPPKTVRWTNPEGIHLTLKFLGDTPVERVDAIAQAMAAAAASFTPFEFTVAGFGCFPNVRRANVLWVGVPDVPKPLAGLQRATDLQLTRLGFDKETRPFSPHLTLGRVNKKISSNDRARLAGVLGQTKVGTLGIVPVEEVILFQSNLQPGGAVYTALARIPLTRDSSKIGDGA